MTSHLDEGRLNALLDGETSAAELTELQAHLEMCAACRAQLDTARALRDEAFALIEMLDAPGPSSERAGPGPMQPVGRPQPGQWRLGLAWAATLVLAVSAGFWARGVMGGTAGPPTGTAPTVLAAEPSALGAADAAKPGAPGEVAQIQPQPEPVTTVPPTRSTETAAGRNLAAAEAVSDRPSHPAEAPRRRDVRQEAEAQLRTAEDRAGTDVAPAAKIARRPDAGADRPAAPAAVPSLAPAAGPAAAAPLDAIRVLGGSLLLIDGLVPEGVGVAEDTVRVTYTTAFGPLVLVQWREGGEVRSQLVPPARAPADSVAAWQRRISRGGVR